jgi:DNA-binding NarL/FixJ family response regulator
MFEMTGNQIITVSLIEDDALLAEGLKSLISRSEGFCFKDLYFNGEDALRQVPLNPPDVLLADINLPGISGIDCIRILKAKLDRMQIMMLTIYEDNDAIFDSLAAGASGYLLKKTPVAELLQAIKDLFAGGAPMSAQIARKVVASFQEKTKSAAAGAELTPREHEIIHLLSMGFLYKEVAQQLSISVETVRTHIRNIYDKLHVRSRTEALLKYYKK